MITPPDPNYLIIKPSPKQESVKEKRIDSAKLNREKNESSKKVFPQPTSDKTKERYRSIYNKDFEGSYTTPLEPRPTSPTRRNNPHPSQQFMVWRVPTREIGAQFMRPGSSMGGPVRDDESEFDDMESLYERYKMPLPQPSSMDYGAYLREMRQKQALQQQQQLLQQQQMQQFVGDRVPSRLSQRGGDYDPYRGPRQGQHILSRTVKESNQDNLMEWLKTASPEEQTTILRMLKEAEEGQAKQAISQVMKPGAAKATSEWLSKADQNEREVAVRLFSSLGSRSGPRQRSVSEPGLRPLSRRKSLPNPPRNIDPAEQQLTSPTVEGKPWPKSLWHHLPVRDPPPRVYHRGSLFGKATGGASHYTIHPEWPDYQQSGFNSDAVH